MARPGKILHETRRGEMALLGELRTSTRKSLSQANEGFAAARGSGSRNHSLGRSRGLTDSEGRYWEPDRLSRGGQLVVRSDPVSLPPYPELYRGERFGNLTFPFPCLPDATVSRSISRKPGSGQTSRGHGGAGSRLFDICYKGVALAGNFDIYKEAGGADRALLHAFSRLNKD